MYMDIAIPDDCYELAPSLKELDKYEIASLGYDPLRALLYPFRYYKKNTITFSLFNNKHQVIAMWGVCPIYKHQTTGKIWFLSTEEPFTNFVKFCKGNIIFVRYVEEHFRYLFNTCSFEQTKTIRWLKFLGFTFKNTPVLVKGQKMLYFYKKPNIKVFRGVKPILKHLGPRYWATQKNKNG